MRNYQILLGEDIERQGADITRPAEQHLKNDDFFHVISGKVTFVIGNKVVDPISRGSSTSDPTLKSSEISDGKVHILGPGQGIHIPAGVWHQWKTEGSLQMRVWKIPAAEGEFES